MKKITDEDILKFARWSPHFVALWEGNAEFIATVFPSMSGDEFDRSCADLALMRILALWTQGDAEQMDRLFRQSALMRDKYERLDYRESLFKAVL